MATLKKYNLQGNELGVVNVSDQFVNSVASGQTIKEYIVAIRENARQWSASTKTRSEVKHTTKKPWKQKGTGRARQGSLVSPQFRGGGIVFGPKPKFDQHVRINQKERRAAIRAMLAEVIREGKMIVVDSLAMDAPKTKEVAHFLSKVTNGKRTLFLGEGSYLGVEVGDKTNTISVKNDQHKHFSMSLRNIQKTHFRLAKNVSGYDVMISQNIVVTEGALQELLEWLGHGGKNESK